MNIFYTLALAQISLAAVVSYNWDITWVWANPDGFARPVIGINNQWPNPPMDVNLGDNVVVNVRNLLGNQSTGIHFHGQYQTGTNTMDGPQGATQCAIAPGESFTYNFTAGPAGSSWYHSHNKGQYPDGIRGPFIIHDPNDPYLGAYEEELTLTVTDWYQSQMPPLLEAYLNPANPDGGEPVPNSTLVNDASNTKFSITPGKTYRLRIISMAAFSSHWVQLEGHNMTIIMVDNVNVKPQTTSSIYISAAQRYDVLFTAKSTATKNYAFISCMDQTMFDGYPDLPQIENENATGYLVYNHLAPLPPPLSVPVFTPYDDFQLVPLDHEPILNRVDNKITINMVFQNDQYNINRATINNQTYVAPLVPTLYTALSAPISDVLNPVIYGVASNPFVVKFNQVQVFSIFPVIVIQLLTLFDKSVEIVINNLDDGSHPWHLHGHQFQVVARSPAGAGTFDGDTSGFPSIPMRRDTTLVNGGGYAVFRFTANNPGIYLLHCHIEWHVESGLTATIIEAPDHLRTGFQNLHIPAGHLEACKLDGIPTVGNAAANTVNWLDLAGAPTAAPKVDYGSLVNPPPS